MIYAYAKITVTNPQALAEYRDVANAALAKHGGKVEVAVREFTVLDGAPDMPNVAALLSFPDKDSAIAWSTAQSSPMYMPYAAVRARQTSYCWVKRNACTQSRHSRT